MDRNGYFFYVASTAKKKKISLMQPKPPRVAFVDKRRPGVAERIECEPVRAVTVSVAPDATENRRVDPMTQRGPSPAPRARLYTQLESYQPRYHTIRDNSDKRVDSECRRRKKEQRITGQPQAVLRWVSHVNKVFFLYMKTQIVDTFLFLTWGVSLVLIIKNFLH